MVSSAEVKEAKAKVKSMTLIITINRLHMILLSIIDSCSLVLLGSVCSSKGLIWRGRGEGRGCIKSISLCKQYHPDLHF